MWKNLANTYKGTFAAYIYSYLWNSISMFEQTFFFFYSLVIQALVKLPKTIPILYICTPNTNYQKQQNYNKWMPRQNLESINLWTFCTVKLSICETLCRVVPFPRWTWCTKAKAWQQFLSGLQSSQMYNVIWCRATPRSDKSLWEQ